MLLLAALAVLQIADLASTAYGFKHGLVEGSPLPGKLFARLGYWPVALTLKAFTLGIAWAAQTYISNGYIFTAALCVIGVGVVAWNIRQIAKA